MAFVTGPNNAAIAAHLVGLLLSLVALFFFEPNNGAGPYCKHFRSGPNKCASQSPKILRDFNKPDTHKKIRKCIVNIIPKV